MSELKPCPFCGEMPEVEPNGDCYCDHYNCPMAPDSYMPGDWNTRPIEDVLQARAEKAEAMVKRLIEAGADLAGFTRSATGDNGHSITLRKWHALVAEWKEREE